MKEDQVMDSNASGVVVPWLDAKLWAKLQEAEIENDRVVFKGNRQLFTTGSQKSGQQAWALAEPVHVPEQYRGPYQLSGASWSSIAGGSLVESRKLIISRDGKIHRLAAVVVEKKKEKGAGVVWAAAAYAPVALNPKPLQTESVVLPTLGTKLWHRMKVGLWSRGGWVSKEEGKVHYLHLDGPRGAEQWALRPRNSAAATQPFPMSEENWDRISCGTLQPGRNIIVKDGRQLRVMGMTVGERRAAMTYTPVVHRAYTRPPAKDAVSKK